MQKRMRVIVTLGGIILLVAILYNFTNWFSIATGYLKGEDEATRLATCLGNSQVEFYGNEFCAECERQINELGEAFDSVNYVDCGREKENCPNIREIPAWFIGGKTVYGFKTFDEIKALSSC